MKNIKLLFTLLIISTALISCKSIKGKKTTETMTSLENTSWQLIKTKDKTYEKNDEKPDGVSISFVDGNFSTSDGCNGLGGEFKFEGNTIEFDKIRATMRYCDKEYMDKYGYYIPFHSVKKFKIKNNTLYLYEADDETIVAEYSKKQ